MDEKEREKEMEGSGNNKDTEGKSVKEKIPKFTLPVAMSGDKLDSQSKETAYKYYAKKEEIS